MSILGKLFFFSLFCSTFLYLRVLMPFFSVDLFFVSVRLGRVFLPSLFSLAAGLELYYHTTVFSSPPVCSCSCSFLSFFLCDPPSPSSPSSRLELYYHITVFSSPPVFSPSCSFLSLLFLWTPPHPFLPLLPPRPPPTHQALPGVRVDESLTAPFQSLICISMLENPSEPSSKLTCGGPKFL